MPETDPRTSLGASAAVSLGGGGARAAYQVGFLRGLAQRVPRLQFPIITGASAGAINAAHLAQFDGSLKDATVALCDLWRGITLDRVFRTDQRSMMPRWAAWFTRLGLGGLSSAPPPRGLLDTAPLRRFLREALGCSGSRIPGIARNLQSGRLRAIGISTTDFGTGLTTTWTQGDALPNWRRPTRRGVPTTIDLDHVMASCAVPLFFPALRLSGGWHGDGGIRQLAPLSPAVKLGASRILSISTRYLTGGEDSPPPAEPIEYPSPAQVMGVLLGAVFNDLLDQDARLLSWVTSLTERLPERERMGFRPVKAMLVHPSRDPGPMARPHEHRLPRMIRVLSKAIGARDTYNFELLSLLMFEPPYTSELIALGEEDARAKAEEIEAFLCGG